MYRIKTAMKKRKEWFSINPLKIQYTNDMEKALHGAHGIGYETYRHDCEKRIEVEKRREKEYVESRIVAANIGGNLSSGN
ncbi:YuzK [Bacillus freudenreichii]|nr:YuzK [Bacillus freudenreichii]